MACRQRGLTLVGIRAAAEQVQFAAAGRKARQFTRNGRAGHEAREVSPGYGARVEAVQVVEKICRNV